MNYARFLKLFILILLFGVAKSVYPEDYLKFEKFPEVKIQNSINEKWKEISQDFLYFGKDANDYKNNGNIFEEIHFDDINGRCIFIPTFRMTFLSKDKIKEVPNPNVKFGIQLIGNRIEKGAIKSLSKFKNLSFLSLKDIEVDENMASEIGDLKTIEILDMKGVRINDENIKKICRKKTISELMFSQTAISNESLKFF
jgi:hypothetical protein